MANQVNLLNESHLNELKQLLELAASNSQENQAQVYRMISCIEHQPITYIYLSHILCSPQYPANLRQMAGLTMSSTLKRNLKSLQFPPEQLQHLKEQLLESLEVEDVPLLTNVKCILVSLLVNVVDFDFKMLAFLVQRVSRSLSALSALRVIVEDLKHNSENYCIFDDPMFVQFLAALAKMLLSILLQAQHSNTLASQQRANALTVECITCLNLMIFHLPQSLNHYLKSYLEDIIMSELERSQREEVDGKLLLLLFGGLNEIFGTKPDLVCMEMMGKIFRYVPRQDGLANELNKCWTNFLTEALDNQPANLGNYLLTILPVLLKHLEHSPENDGFLKESMQIQFNPYEQQSGSPEPDEQQDDTQTSTYEQSYGKATATPLRKLTCLLLEKMSVEYCETLWALSRESVYQRLTHQQWIICETAVLCIGILAETCSDTFGEEATGIITQILELASRAKAAMLRATSMWTLGKLMDLLVVDVHSINIGYELCLNNIEQQNCDGNHLHQFMLKESSTSFLDELITASNKTQMHPPQQTIKKIVYALLHGLQKYSNRLLFHVFKAISSIFQSDQIIGSLTESEIDYVMLQLCGKWANNKHKDSVMCPLLQCIVEACEHLKIRFEKYSRQITNQVLAILEQTDRKQQLVRALNLLSAMITQRYSQLAGIVCDHGFLQLIGTLAKQPERQIHNFALALIGDLVKSYPIPNGSQQLLATVAQTLDPKSITSINVTFLCMCDILLACPQLLAVHGANLLKSLVETVEGNRVAYVAMQIDRIIAANLARVYCRLANYLPDVAKHYLLENEKMTRFVFGSLRTGEKQLATEESFRGLLRTLALYSDAELLAIGGNNLQYLVDTLSVYPFDNVDNNELITNFRAFVRKMRQLMGASWQSFLSRPIFLPAAANKINNLSM